MVVVVKSYVGAMGGTLNIVAKFPDRPSIVLAGIAALDEE